MDIRQLLLSGNPNPDPIKSRFLKLAREARGTRIEQEVKRQARISEERAMTERKIANAVAYLVDVSNTMETNNAHPGKVVRELMRLSGMTQQLAAKWLHTSAQQVFNLCAGERDLNWELSSRLSQLWGVLTADEWMVLQINHDKDKWQNSEGRRTDIEPFDKHLRRLIDDQKE